MVNSTSRYSTPSIVMHWLTVVVFIGIYAAINLADVFPKESVERQLVKNIHFSLGLLVFGLVWLRIVLRVFGGTPAIVPPPPGWNDKLAKLGHLALYALMLLLPLIGWSVLSASGKPIPFFGLEMPALIGENKPLGRTLKDIHELGGNVGYFLIGGHAAAALFHHYFMQDNTLLRMTWWRQVPRKGA
jgi:cytochrome b561